MKKAIVSFITLAAVFSLNAPPSFAFCPIKKKCAQKVESENKVVKQGPAKTLEQKNAELETKLKFTTAQRKKARALRAAEQRESAQITKQINAKKAELTSVEDSKFEFGKIRAKKTQKEQLKKDIQALESKKTAVTAKYTKQYDSMLNTTQKKQLDKIRAENSLQTNAACAKCKKHATKCSQDPCRHKKWFHRHKK